MENLQINGDNLLYIKGAKKVLSCTESQAVIETETKKVVITGNNIEVKNLNLENCEVCLFGNYSQIKFLQEGEKKSLFKRIFK